MLNLKLADGSALDIPAHSILMVEEGTENKKETNIVYALEPGQNFFDTVKATYGFMKKTWRDNMPSLGNVLEVTLANENPHKMAFPDSMVIARRELKDAPFDAKTRLTLNVGGKVMSINVQDSRDTIAGE